MSTAPAIGLATALTHESLQPAELARWLEDNGFESLFLGEHTHLPAAVHRYGDGWIPLDGADHAEFLGATLAAIRSEAERAGRSMDEFDLTVGLGLMGPVTEKRFDEVVKLGFRRVLFLPRAGSPPEEAWPVLEGFAKLKSQLV